jgi:hypothetical protein
MFEGIDSVLKNDSLANPSKLRIYPAARRGHTRLQTRMLYTKERILRNVCLE